MARLFADRPHSSAEYRDFLMQTGWFDDVLILDAEHLRYPKLTEEIQPDVIFYGGEYGYSYLQDSEYTLRHGIYNLMMGHRAFVDYDEYRGVIDDKTLKIMKRVHQLGSMLPIRLLAFWGRTKSSI